MSAPKFLVWHRMDLIYCQRKREIVLVIMETTISFAGEGQPVRGQHGGPEEARRRAGQFVRAG